MDKFQEFHLVRIEDESGVSGTGVVARGCVFPSGRVVMEWQTFHSSICHYNNLTDVDSIHGHQGKTRIVMGAPVPPELTTPYHSLKNKKKAK